MPKTRARDPIRYSRGYGGVFQRQDEVDDKKMVRVLLGSGEADMRLLYSEVKEDWRLLMGIKGV